jgi:hypothetical protein
MAFKARHDINIEVGHGAGSNPYTFDWRRQVANRPALQGPHPLPPQES